MKVLIIGSGGREHALAWKVAQSPRVSQIFVAPGNAGTHSRSASLRGLSHAPRHTQNIAITQDDHSAIVQFAEHQQIDLIIIGPEAPLAAGLADRLRDAGKMVFGPSQAAAQIEASKAFAKAFMQRHNIPTARFAIFSDFRVALKHLISIEYPIVIKASGLAAGKGVVIPDCADDAEAALRHIMLDHEFGVAGDEVIIEEKLIGEEVSLLAFTDGLTLKPMPPAQDHKRLLDGDQGPNTGGMGAYSPAPICPSALVDELTRSILQPTIAGLRIEDRLFMGVIYAGLMLTADGPRVLEYNCRFGDPETQVILPLLETDLVDVAEACATQQLDTIDLRWKQQSAACVVLASEGYPNKYPIDREINGLDQSIENAMIFHAGTKMLDGKIVTSSGRVLNAVGLGSNLQAALQNAYTLINHISFQGMQYRQDIGHRALGSSR
jgi:phosphoribosylamine--glycine ligase